MDSPRSDGMFTVWCGADLLHAHDDHLAAVQAARYEAVTHGGEITVRLPSGAVDRHIEAWRSHNDVAPRSDEEIALLFDRLGSRSHKRRR